CVHGVGVVVRELGTGPGPHPGATGVGGLEVRVSLVLGVPDPVVVERAELRTGVLSDQAVPTAGFVDIVTQMESQVHVVVGNMLISGEVALFPMRAGGERDPERLGTVVDRRCGAGTTDRAGRVAGPEPVPIPAVRPK